MFQEIQKQLERERNIPKYLCYTLDLEEDHAGLLHDYYEGLNYLEKFIHIVEENEIQISFFIQAKIFEKFPEKIELIRDYNFDIHLHSYLHSLRRSKDLKSTREDIEKSRRIYHDFFGAYPKGYRFPLGFVREKDYLVLNKLNFKFDSSIFPSLRFGFFNNLNKPLKPYKVHGIVEIPFSVISKMIRIPISLSYIKLFYPLHFLMNYHFSPLIFDFHMHDLFNLKITKNLNFRKLHYIRKSKKGLDIFLKFDKKLKKEGYNSVKIYEIYKNIKNNLL